MAYAYELEQKGIDLTQDFTVYSFNDFDAEGWDIPEAFIAHLKLKSLGVRIDRLTREQEEYLAGWEMGT